MIVPDLGRKLQSNCCRVITSINKNRTVEPISELDRELTSARIFASARIRGDPKD